jgi:hypothetical protein
MVDAPPQRYRRVRRVLEMPSVMAREGSSASCASTVHRGSACSTSQAPVPQEALLTHPAGGRTGGSARRGRAPCLDEAVLVVDLQQGKVLLDQCCVVVIVHVWSIRCAQPELSMLSWWTPLWLSWSGLGRAGVEQATWCSGQLPGREPWLTGRGSEGGGPGLPRRSRRRAHACWTAAPPRRCAPW